MWSEVAPLVGEPPALDFVNTVVHCRSGRVDLISTPEELHAWLILVGDRVSDLSPTEITALGDAELATIHATRDAIYPLIHAARDGKRPPDASVDLLNDLMRAVPRIPRLGWDGSAVTSVELRSGSAVERLCASVASATAAMIADGSVHQVRECADPRCIWLFLPKNSRRRWCDPSICGNRARVARYYHRHKATEPAI
ncbi:ABATE domain-containing protein [Spiractinospora alimapuensis]|uniref:CGNR zinc finger domain-containing protein n=1 Tax=Spiractinospora alimapuensis TaxID=2820884 RepID=UPI001F380AE8|nr:ABATE domain-containing protein [Spiractinospora alimapuensis]QVQ50749.1 ABATE domain-containing protein [Spiractinospora alimapuensis]